MNFYRILNAWSIKINRPSNLLIKNYKKIMNMTRFGEKEMKLKIKNVRLVFSLLKL